MKIKKIILGAAFVAAPLFMPQLVIAEESVDMMEEVIVTSRRKNESVQDVPLSVTVFGEERCSARNESINLSLKLCEILMVSHPMSTLV